MGRTMFQYKVLSVQEEEGTYNTQEQVTIRSNYYSLLLFLSYIITFMSKLERLQESNNEKLALKSAFRKY